MKKAFSSLICLGTSVLFCACEAIRQAEYPEKPKDQCLWILAEIHGNHNVRWDVYGEYNEDCLVKGEYLLPLEYLQKDDVVIVRKGDSTALAVFGKDPVTQDNYIAKAEGVYSKIGHDPIPLSYWGSDTDYIPGTTRVLEESGGKSMIPVLPEHSILTLTLGYPYDKLKKLKEKEKMVIVTFWDAASGRGFTTHALDSYFSNGSWTTQGVNNAGLPTYFSMERRGDASSYVTIVHESYSRGKDPYPLTRSTYIGVIHKVWKDLTVPSQNIVALSSSPR